MVLVQSWYRKHSYNYKRLKKTIQICRHVTVRQIKKSNKSQTARITSQWEVKPGAPRERFLLHMWHANPNRKMVSSANVAYHTIHGNRQDYWFFLDQCHVEKQTNNQPYKYVSPHLLRTAINRCSSIRWRESTVSRDTGNMYMTLVVNTYQHRKSNANCAESPVCLI